MSEIKGDRMSEMKLVIGLATALVAVKGMAFVEEIEDVRVAPLIETRWAQSYWGGKMSGGMVFNRDTPGNSVCGCGVTASAQLMRYYAYPDFPLEPMSNDCVYHDQSETYAREVLHLTTKGGIYEWSKMPCRYDTHPELDDVERDAIAKLTSDLGISFGVSYMYRDHETNTDKETLVANFKRIWKYRSGHYIWLTVPQGEDLPDWALQAIFGSLNAKRPVVVWCKSESDGHTFLLDGYGYHHGRPYIHANCGWSGRSDGWYAFMNDVVSDLTTLRYIAFNIHPSHSGQILSGRVTDGEGRPIFGAMVSAIDEADGNSRSTETDEHGIYAFVVNRASSFRVTAEKDGVRMVRSAIQMSMPTTTTTATDDTNSKVLLENARTIGNRFDVDFELSIPNAQRRYTIRFDLGRHGRRIGGGELTQAVLHGALPVEPRVGGMETWKFDGWCPKIESAARDCVYQARFADPDGDSQPDCYVDIHADPAGDGTTPEKALTSMINGLSLVPSGGVVSVAAGIYPPLKFTSNKPLLIKSSCGKQYTVFDGGGTNRAVHLGTNYVGCLDTVVRGFTIQNGYRSGSDVAGAGAYAGTYVDCDFRNNVIDGNGAAAYGATLIGCRVFDNVASGNGGGVGRCSITNSIFVNNSAGGSGGGVYRCSLVDCIVVSNSANYGGGVYAGLVESSDVSYNRSNRSGGGAYRSCLDNTVIAFNASTNDDTCGGGCYECTNKDCVVQGNYAGLSGGGAYRGVYTKCVFNGNTAGNTGGGAYDSMLTDCVVASNSAIYAGGLSRGRADRTRIVDNVSTEVGGGTHRSRLVDSLIVGNRAGSSGGGCYECTNVNCTVYGNYAGNRGGGAYGGVYTNCIVWGNASGNGYADFRNSGPCGYCLSGTALDGVGNITGDPKMNAPEKGDFRLRSDSPCLNAGWNGAVVGLTDVLGHSRIQNGVVDIGACEGVAQSTLSTEVEVPYWWLDQYPTLLKTYGGDYELAAKAKTGKRNSADGEMCVWEDYVVGTDPTKSNDLFTAYIDVGDDGKISISYSPRFEDEGERALRKYTMLGKKNLHDGSWREVPEGRESEYNFFKVKVEMR